jgi:hypothetical protein
MTDLTLESLAERVKRLERQNRLFKALAIGAVAVLAAVVCMGQVAAPKVVEAEKFVVRDGDGNERARLVDIGVVLLSADGKPRGGLTVAEDVPSLHLLHPQHGGGVYMSPLGMAVRGPGQKSKAANVGISHEGEPFVSLSDGEEKTRARLSLAKDGRPGLALYDTKGEIRARLRLDEDGRPDFELIGAEGARRVILTVDEIQQQLADRLLTPERSALLDALERELLPELRKMYNILADLDRRLAQLEG